MPPARARTLEALADTAIVEDHKALLEAAFGNSPYLARLALREREFLTKVLARDPGEALAQAMSMAEQAAGAADESAAMRWLRTAKRQASLVIAFADISGAWTIEQVTRALSAFADVCVSAALRFLFAPGGGARRVAGE